MNDAPPPLITLFAIGAVLSAASVAAATSLGAEGALVAGVSTAPWLFVGLVVLLRRKLVEKVTLDTELAKHSGQLERRSYEDGDVIVAEGDSAEHLFIIAAGRVAVWHEDNRGTRVDLVELTEGQYFGEIGLLDGGIRSATVEAVGEVELLAMSRKTFEQVVAGSAAAKRAIERVARERALSG